MAKEKNKPVPAIADNVFQYQDKKYKVVFPGVNIPGLGVRTAAEIVVDEEAQKELVERKSSAIVELV